MWNVDVVAGELGPGPITASAVEAGGVMVIEPLVNPKDMKEAVFLVVVFFSCDHNCWICGQIIN